MSNEITEVVDLIEALSNKVENTNWYILDKFAKSKVFSDINFTNTLYQVYYTTDDGELLELEKRRSPNQEIIFIGKIGVRYYYDEDLYEEKNDYFITFASKVEGDLDENEKITYLRSDLIEEKYIEGKDLFDLFKKVQLKVNEFNKKIKNWHEKLDN